MADRAFRATRLMQAVALADALLFITMEITPSSDPSRAMGEPVRQSGAELELCTWKTIETLVDPTALFELTTEYPLMDHQGFKRYKS